MTMSSGSSCEYVIAASACSRSVITRSKKTELLQPTLQQN